LSIVKIIIIKVIYQQCCVFITVNVAASVHHGKSGILVTEKPTSSFVVRLQAARNV